MSSLEIVAKILAGLRTLERSALQASPDNRLPDPHFTGKRKGIQASRAVVEEVARVAGIDVSMLDSAQLQ